MNKKTTGYRAQKATTTVQAKIAQVEEFSNYIISPMRKRYDIFCKSTMITFKAIRCWLKLKVSENAPKNWSEKRRRIDDRITALVRNSVNTASIEELPVESDNTANDIHNYPNVSQRNRLEIGQRNQDIKRVVEYNILGKKEDRKIDDWKSYPGISNIIDMARDLIENGKENHIKELVTIMQCHESQQSAGVVATIAILIDNKINIDGMNIDKECRKAIGDVILWDTPVMTNRDAWPSRQKYSFMQIFNDPGELLETKTSLAELGQAQHLLG